MLLCPENGLCDGGLLVVGRHGDEGPDCALPFPWPSPAVSQIPDENGFSIAVIVVPGNRLIYAGCREVLLSPTIRGSGAGGTIPGTIT